MSTICNCKLCAITIAKDSLKLYKYYAVGIANNHLYNLRSMNLYIQMMSEHNTEISYFQSLQPDAEEYIVPISKNDFYKIYNKAQQIKFSLNKDCQ